MVATDCRQSERAVSQAACGAASQVMITMPSQGPPLIKSHHSDSTGDPVQLALTDPGAIDQVVACCNGHLAKLTVALAVQQVRQMCRSGT